MELKENSWHAWYYKQFYRIDLPKSFCTYFWLLVFSLISFPFTFPGMIFNYFLGNKTRNELPGWTGGPLLAFCWLIGQAAVKKMHLNFFSEIGVGFLLLLGVCIGLFLFLFIIWKGFDIYWDYTIAKDLKNHGKPKKEKQPSIFYEGIKSFFGKYCPKITWVNKDNS